MGIAFTQLGSGSRGNSTLISTEETNILVDQGLSIKQAEKRLQIIGVDPQTIDHILVSHEHGDHAGSVIKSAKKWCSKVHATSPCAHIIGEKKDITIFEPLERIELGKKLSALPIPVPHDSAQNVGFIISDGKGKRGAIASDLGHVTDEIRHHLKGCQHISIEANYDTYLMKKSPYPEHLKSRIEGKLGHLSNEQTANLLSDVVNPDTSSIALLHLSETNNRPQAAETSILLEIEEIYDGVLGVCSQKQSDFTIFVGEAELHRPGSGLNS